MTTLPGTVLVVEDEDSLRRLVAEFLRGENYIVIEAEDGPAGAERFADSGPFDLAILDLNLPGYSGVEVARRIRAIHPGQNILICSAAISREAEDTLLEIGVVDFLTKPYHPEVLRAHVERMIRPKSPPRLSVVSHAAQ